MDDELSHISLFTGIGGIDIAAEWAGFETILMVEKDAYCQKVLKKHWPNVPILEDIFNVNKETIQEALANAFGRGEQQSERYITEGRGWTSNGSEEESLENARCQYGEGELLKREHEEKDSERATTPHKRPDSSSRADISGDAAKLPPITLITGGFPCQPVSQAGKRRGKEDDRYLWPEMLRVITEVRPRWVVAENVAGLITMGLDDCLSDLEREGYITETFLIPACALNAPHRRDRIFIVAYCKDKGLEGRKRFNRRQELGQQGGSLGNEFGPIRQDATDSKGISPGHRNDGDGEILRSAEEEGKAGVRISTSRTPEQALADPRLSDSQKRQGPGECRDVGGESSVGTSGSSGIHGREGLEGWSIHGAEQWSVEPDVGRVAHGVPARVDRLRALGNAVVPQQIYPILKAIADIERLK